MGPAEIGHKLKASLGDEKVLDVRADVLEPYIRIAPAALREAAQLLRHDPDLAFDFFSFRHRHRIALKVRVPRDDPRVPTVSDIWRTAEWHEREAYDLLGIVFEGHPDLRRILLPEDWEGFPLRKDYKVQAYYHDIPVPYDIRQDFEKGTWVFEEEVRPA